MNNRHQRTYPIDLKMQEYVLSCESDAGNIEERNRLADSVFGAAAPLARPALVTENSVAAEMISMASSGHFGVYVDDFYSRRVMEIEAWASTG